MILFTWKYSSSSRFNRIFQSTSCNSLYEDSLSVERGVRLACGYDVIHTRLRLSSYSVGGPAQHGAVVHFCPRYIVKNASRPIYSGNVNNRRNTKHRDIETADKTPQILIFSILTLELADWNSTIFQNCFCREIQNISPYL